MIFAFKSKLYDWEEEFTSGVWDMELKDKIEPGKMEMIEGPTYYSWIQSMQKSIDRVERYRKNIE